MKKKIIRAVFCVILLLIFTALSYGEMDPKYNVKKQVYEHPWDHITKGQAITLLPILFNTTIIKINGSDTAFSKTSNKEPINNSNTFENIEKPCLMNQKNFCR